MKRDKLIPGKTHAIQFSKVITGGLNVKVLFDGQAAAGASVSVSPSVHAGQTTSSDGIAIFNLAAGSYQVTAVSADGEWSGNGSAQVESDKTATALVELVYGRDGRTRSGGL